jgi:O-antigen/teichoic acid export membrane protein
MNIFTLIKKLFINKFFLNFLNYYSFTVINVIIGFYSISYLSKKISPEDYGMLGIFGSILFLLPSIISFSANGLQSVEIVNKRKKDYILFRNVLFSFLLCSSIFFFVVAILSCFYFKDYAFVIISAFFMGFAMVCTSIHNTELVQNTKASQFGLLSSGSISVSFFLTVLFLSLFELDWKFRILALIIAEYIFVFIRFYLISEIWKSFKFSLDFKFFKVFLEYGTPLIVAAFSGFIMHNADRYFNLNFFGIREVGLYTAAAGVASVISSINSNMIKVLYPYVFELLNNRIGKIKILKIIICYTIFILSIAGIFSSIIYFFGYLFLGEKYLIALNIIYILCFAQAFFGIYSISSLLIDYFKLTKVKTILIVSCCTILILLNFIIIPEVGLLGSAISILISFIILAGSTFIYSLSLFSKYKII